MPFAQAAGRDLGECGCLQGGLATFLCQTIHHPTDGYPIIQPFAYCHTAVIYGHCHCVTTPNRNIREALWWSSPCLDWKLLLYVHFFGIFLVIHFNCVCAVTVWQLCVAPSAGLQDPCVSLATQKNLGSCGIPSRAEEREKIVSFIYFNEALCPGVPLQTSAAFSCHSYPGSQAAFCNLCSTASRLLRISPGTFTTPPASCSAFPLPC